MARLSVRRRRPQPTGPPCATCGVPLEQGATVCPHCGRRLDRPARSVPLYARKERRRSSTQKDVALLFGSFALIFGLLALALIPLLRRGADPPESPPKAETVDVPRPPPDPAPPAPPPPVTHAIPVEKPAPVVRETPKVAAAAPAEVIPARPPAPVEAPPEATPAAPPPDATLEDLLQGYALGHDLYWDALVRSATPGVTAEADEHLPIHSPGTSVDVRRGDGQVVRGTLLELGPGTIRLGDGSGETEVAARELKWDERLRLDPAFRKEYIQTLVSEDLFERLPDRRRADAPPPGASLEMLQAAALRGSIPCARRAGMGHLSDVGQEPDPARAYAYLLLASKWGDAEAQFQLGRLYYRGIGTKSNEGLSMDWINRALHQGHEPARRFVAAHRQREAAYRRAVGEAAATLEQQMQEEAAGLREAAGRPPVTLFKRTSDGDTTAGADAGVTPGP